MRALPLHKLLAGHECSTAQQRGWAGIKNGELLRRAEAEFDLFVTADQGIRYQQSLAGRKTAIWSFPPTTCDGLSRPVRLFNKLCYHLNPANTGG